jgi:hypothetical protein
MLTDLAVVDGVVIAAGWLAGTARFGEIELATALSVDGEPVLVPFAVGLSSAAGEIAWARLYGDYPEAAASAFLSLPRLRGAAPGVDLTVGCYGDYRPDGATACADPSGAPTFNVWRLDPASGEVIDLRSVVDVGAPDTPALVDYDAAGERFVAATSDIGTGEVIIRARPLDGPGWSAVLSPTRDAAVAQGLWLDGAGVVVGIADLTIDARLGVPESSLVGLTRLDLDDGATLWEGELPLTDGLSTLRDVASDGCSLTVVGATGQRFDPEAPPLPFQMVPDGQGFVARFGCDGGQPGAARVVRTAGDGAADLMAVELDEGASLVVGGVRGQVSFGAAGAVTSEGDGADMTAARLPD